MNVISRINAVAMDLNGPPGLTHPLLQEKYAWVDQRLSEMYHNYALTGDNCNEYQDAGLLTENYAWVDRKLEEMCNIDIDNATYLRYMRLTPISMGGLAKKGVVLKKIEDSDDSTTSSGNKRSRSEQDISEFEVEAQRVIKRLGCQSPIAGKLHIHLPSVCYDEEWENDSAVSSISCGDFYCVTPSDEYSNDHVIDTFWPEGVTPIVPDYDLDTGFNVISDYENDKDSLSVNVCISYDCSESDSYDIGYDSY